jgi:hypothetical protein
VTVLGASYAPDFARPSWALGDFEYNNFVDNDDVTLLGALYGQSSQSAPAPALFPSVHAANDQSASQNSARLAGMVDQRPTFRASQPLVNALNPFDAERQRNLRRIAVDELLKVDQDLRRNDRFSASDGALPTETSLARRRSSRVNADSFWD